MRLSVVLVPATIALAALVATAAAHPPRLDPALPDVTRAAEVGRIRAHFDSVLTELTSHDPSALTAAQHARRASLLATLRAYRVRGEFPHNYDFPGQAVPYFVDRGTGTLCAVAHLLESTGRRDVVDRVARKNNNVWVSELAGDTAFTSWLDTNGLTLAEAARIQVPYMGGPPTVVSASHSPSRTYAFASAVAIGGSAVSALWNARGNSDGHRTLANYVGITTGALTLGLGAAALSDRDTPAAVAPLSLVAGGLTTYLSTRGFMRHRQYVSAERSRRVAATVSPILPVPGSKGAGLAVHLTF
jgi:hypothetical protein